MARTISSRNKAGMALTRQASQDLNPHIVGEFDDSALVKAFGSAGAGLFVGPSAIADSICEQYKVVQIGRIDTVIEQVYVITTERKLTNPAIVEISKSAREVIFNNEAKAAL